MFGLSGLELLVRVGQFAFAAMQIVEQPIHALLKLLDLFLSFSQRRP